MADDEVLRAPLPRRGLSDIPGGPINPLLIVSIVALLDVAAMLFFFAWSYSQADLWDPWPSRIWKITDAIFCGSVLYVTVISGGYSQANLSKPFSQVSRILVSSSLIVLVEWLALYLTNQLDDFAWPLNGPINIVSGAVMAMCAIRLGTYRILLVSAQNGMIVRSVAVVGSGLHGQRLLEALIRRKEPWTKIVGIFDDRKTRAPETIAEVKLSGSISDLIALARNQRIDDILVALPWGAETRLLELLSKLKEIPANIRLAPDVIGHHFLDKGFGRVDGVPVFDVFSKPIGGWGALSKRIEDLVLTGVIMIVALPIMALCTLAIKLDSPGPALFRQNRFGYNNKLIGVYKFRTMYHDMTDLDADRQTTKDDPRITRVGKVLRRTSLDELPQLFNVLLGDMSIVGPRPHATNTKAAGRLFDEVVHEYSARHRVKPGITGWAQVMGWRGETDTEEKIIRRVECDLYYMENWSLFLDIEILFRTIFVVTGRNVY